MNHYPNYARGYDYGNLNKVASPQASKYPYQQQQQQNNAINKVTPTGQGEGQKYQYTNINARPNTGANKTVESPNKTQLEIMEMLKQKPEHQSISEMKDLQVLDYEYSNTFIKKNVQELFQIYPYYRSSRGDGNCFYRACLFFYFEQILQQADVLSTLQYILDSVTQKQINLNICSDKTLEPQKKKYIAHIYEIFQNGIQKLLNEARNTKLPKDRVQAFESMINESDAIDFALEIYIRSLLLNTFNQNKKEYEFYLQGNEEFQIKEYGRDAEGVVFKFMADAIGQKINIVQLYPNQKFQINTYECENLLNYSKKIKLTHDITCLFRPGHYDLFYQREFIQKQYSYLYTKISRLMKPLQQSPQPTNQAKTNNSPKNQEDNPMATKIQNIKICKICDSYKQIANNEVDICIECQQKQITKQNYEATNNQNQKKEDQMQQQQTSQSPQNNQNNTSPIKKFCNQCKIMKLFSSNLEIYCQDCKAKQEQFSQQARKKQEEEKELQHQKQNQLNETPKDYITPGVIKNQPLDLNFEDIQLNQVELKQNNSNQTQLIMTPSNQNNDQVYKDGLTEMKNMQNTLNQIAKVSQQMKEKIDLIQSDRQNIFNLQQDTQKQFSIIKQDFNSIKAEIQKATQETIQNNVSNLINQRFDQLVDLQKQSQSNYQPTQFDQKQFMNEIQSQISNQLLENNSQLKTEIIQELSIFIKKEIYDAFQIEKPPKMGDKVQLDTIVQSLEEIKKKQSSIDEIKHPSSQEDLQKQTKDIVEEIDKKLQQQKSQFENMMKKYITSQESRIQVSQQESKDQLSTTQEMKTSQHQSEEKDGFIQIDNINTNNQNIQNLSKSKLPQGNQVLQITQVKYPDTKEKDIKLKNSQEQAQMEKSKVNQDISNQQQLLKSQVKVEAKHEYKSPDTNITGKIGQSTMKMTGQNPQKQPTNNQVNTKITTQQNQQPTQHDNLTRKNNNNVHQNQYNQPSNIKPTNTAYNGPQTQYGTQIFYANPPQYKQ